MGKGLFLCVRDGAGGARQFALELDTLRQRSGPGLQGALESYLGRAQPFQRLYPRGREPRPLGELADPPRDGIQSTGPASRVPDRGGDTPQLARRAPGILLHAAQVGGRSRKFAVIDQAGDGGDFAEFVTGGASRHRQPLVLPYELADHPHRATVVDIHRLRELTEQGPRVIEFALERVQ